MAPSRGSSASHSTGHQDDVAIDQQSRSALVNARRNFNYLMNPTKNATDRPTRIRTRALLRTVRYITQFVLWRLVRWAKYAAVGAVVAAVGATAFGTFLTGFGWVLAPPSIGAGAVAASIWGVGKFAARRLHARWKTTGMDLGDAQREEQEDSPVKTDGRYGTELGPQVVPW